MLFKQKAKYHTLDLFVLLFKSKKYFFYILQKVNH
jgi:hypothetical protein